MTKIEELLKPGENVIKKQGGVTVGKGVAGMPSGDLILTNMRLIFLHRKRWALLSPIPAASLMGKDIQIPLRNIKTVDKSLGNLKIKASTPTTPLKEYQFATSVWHASGWVDAIRQTLRTPSNPSTYLPPQHQPQPQQSNPPVHSRLQVQAQAQQSQPQQPQSVVRKFCPNCGNPVNTADNYCRSCRAKLL